MKYFVYCTSALLLVVCKKPTPQPSISNHPAIVAFVSGTQAKVITQKGSAALAKGTMLYQSDRIETGPKTQVDVMLPNKILIRIDQNSTVEMRTLETSGDGGQSDKLYLQRGIIFAKVTKLGQNSSFAIQTPTVVAGVRGTQFMTSSDAKGSGKVAVTEGKVAVKSSSAEQAVDAGQQAQISDNGALASEKIDDATAAQMKDFMTIADAREQQREMFENAMKERQEAFERAGGTKKVEGIIEENNKMMQEQRDAATKKVEDQKAQTEGKIQEMKKGTADSVDKMNNSIEEQRKKREQMFKKFEK